MVDVVPRTTSRATSDANVDRIMFRTATPPPPRGLTIPLPQPLSELIDEIAAKV